MLRCQDCPLWKRSFYPGVPKQITGRCGSDRNVRLAKDRSPGVGYSWPVTLQNDWCDLHPEYESKKRNEPFETESKADPVIPAAEFPLRGFPKRRNFNGNPIS